MSVTVCVHPVVNMANCDSSCMYGVRGRNCDGWLQISYDGENNIIVHGMTADSLDDLARRINAVAQDWRERDEQRAAAATSAKRSDQDCIA